MNVPAQQVAHDNVSAWSHAVLLAGSTRPFLARVADDDGSTPLTQADISAIEYTIQEVRGGELEPVSGHAAVALTVADVIFDALQTDAVWTEDATGYNFRFSPDTAENQAFPAWGQVYLVQVTVTRASGDPIQCAWRVRTPEP